MFPKLIKLPSDLVTSHAEICKGFLSQAFTKTEKATRFIEDARKLYKLLQHAKAIEGVLGLPDIQDALIAASGFSDKARTHLSANELESALKKILQTIAQKARDDWREEIMYRYLLTQGDTLGGSMRNLTGALAGIQLTKAILTALRERKIAPSIHYSPANPDKVQVVEWPRRLLLFDKKPQFIGKSIDAILLNTEESQGTRKEHLSRQSDYIACGELKGGIDPAGADEHWKTANSALHRIRSSFRKNCPALFFVGASIAPAMAQEIFDQLKKGRLAYVANLTVPGQLRDLAEWLIRL